MMQGFPTIVIGLFIFGVVSKKQSGFAASLALAMVMLPLIARTSQEVLLTIPQSLREATDALGIDRWRSILTVILPTALGGILTGAILAIARAAGETAPLLILDGLFNASNTTIDIFGHGVPNLPLLIWEAAEGGTPAELVAGVGDRARAARFDLDRKHQRARAAGAQPEEDGAMSIDPPDQLARAAQAFAADAGASAGGRGHGRADQRRQPRADPPGRVRHH